MPDLIFDTLTSPEGVAFDPEGNLYLSTLRPPASLPGSPDTDPTIIKLDRNGAVVNQLSLTGATFASPRLDFLPELDSLVLFAPNGGLALLNPDTLDPIGAIDISRFAFDTSAIYDVATGEVSDFGGLIQPQLAAFGDIDVRVVDEDTVQFFVTGYAEGQTTPFVTRLELEVGVGFTEAKVILASSAETLPTASQSPRRSRGIAVNDQGIALTTLPIATPDPIATELQPLDVMVAFGADMNVNDGFSPEEVPVIFDGIDLHSQGLTTDAAGNFYIATNSVGTEAFGIHGEGALVGISANLDQIIAVESLGYPASSFRDVAIDPLTGTPYATVNTFSVGTPDDDILVAFAPEPVAPALPTAPAPDLPVSELASDNVATATVSQAAIDIAPVDLESASGGIAETPEAVADPLLPSPAVAVSAVSDLATV